MSRPAASHTPATSSPARSRLARGLAGGLVAALVLVACAGGDDPPVDTDDTEASTSLDDAAAPSAASDDATFTYVAALDVITEWDPAAAYSNELWVLQNVYETLTRFDPVTEQAAPLLAESWEVDDEGTSWRFQLRPDVVFHSGAPLDADAVIASIERTIELDAGPAYIWDPVASMAAPAPDVVEFVLSYPAPLDLIAASAFGAYIHEVTADDDLEGFFAEGGTAGTGPYTVADWQPGAELEVRLTAFDGYWGGWDGARFTAVDFRVVPETATAWQLLQAGEVDHLAAISPQLFAQAQQTDAIIATETPSFQNLFALLNTASGPLSDVRVREAFTLAIDQAGLVAALDGAAVAASGIVPDGLLGAVPGRELVPDLDRAAELLAEAGFGPDGEQLVIDLTYAQGDDAQQLLVTLLGSALQQLGVDLDASPLQWNAQWDRGRASDPAQRQDVYVMYWYPDYPDAFSWFVSMFLGEDEPFFNLSYLSEPDIDELIGSIPELTATDPDAAQEVYEQLQIRILDEEVAAAVLLVENHRRVTSDRVQGFVDNPAYPNVVHVHALTRAG